MTGFGDEIYRKGIQNGKIEGRLEGRIEGERAGRIEGERTGRIEGEQLHLIKLVIKKIEREMKTDRLSISQKKEQYGIQIISAAIFNYLFNMFNTQNYKI